MWGFIFCPNANILDDRCCWQLDLKVRMLHWHLSLISTFTSETTSEVTIITEETTDDFKRKLTQLEQNPSTGSKVVTRGTESSSFHSRLRRRMGTHVETKTSQDPSKIHLSPTVFVINVSKSHQSTVSPSVGSGAKTTIITLGTLFVVSSLVIIYMCYSRRNRHRRNHSSSMIFIHRVDDHLDTMSMRSDQERTLMMDNERRPSLRNPLAVAMSAITPDLMKENTSRPKVLRENDGCGQTFNHSFKDRRLSRSLETICKETDGGFWIDCHLSEEDIRINLKKTRGSQSQRHYDPRTSGRYPMGSNNLWNNPLCRSSPSLSKQPAPQVSNQNYEDMTSPHHESSAISNTYSFPIKSDDGKPREWPTEKNLSRERREEPQRHLPINLDVSQDGEEIETPLSTVNTKEGLPTSSPGLQREDNPDRGTIVPDMGSRPLPPIPQQETARETPPRYQRTGASMPSRDASSVRSIVSERRVRFEEGFWHFTNVGGTAVNLYLRHTPNSMYY